MTERLATSDGGVLGSTADYASSESVRTTSYSQQLEQDQGNSMLNDVKDFGLEKDCFSNESLVSTEEGLVTKSRSVRRLPSSQHFPAPLLQVLRVALWGLDHYLTVRQMQIEDRESNSQPMEIEGDRPLPRLND